MFLFQRRHFILYKHSRICRAVDGCAFFGRFKRQPSTQLDGGFDLRGFGFGNSMLFHQFLH